MAKPQAIFIELNISNKFRYACDIIEKLYDNGLSVTIYTDDKKKAGNLDRQLWTWKQETFIPHSIRGQIQTDSEIEESIIITTDSEFAVLTDTLMLFDPLPERLFDKFKYIIDFAEVYDPKRVVQSRERFKQMRDSELYELNFYKLGEFLSKYTFS